MSAPLLEVGDLRVAYDTPAGTVGAVRGVDLALGSGDSVAVVGESGSGKSQLAYALLGLNAPGARVTGSVRYRGRELLGAAESELNRVRGSDMAMVFQDPMTSLNPYLRIREQMAEVLVHHRGMSRGEAVAESVRALERVRVPAARERMGRYPHEFSGGMRQRVMIAMALLCRPRILVADEPTTALDVTVQAQILDLLEELRREDGMALILISHDLGVVAGLCDEMLVMYAGRVVERGTVAALLDAPYHPYTRGLVAAIPVAGPGAGELRGIPGNPPDPVGDPAGCAFAPRCPDADSRCTLERPVLRSAEGRARACHRRPEQLS
jgi:oligopeptide transport system ATP-binding protein